MTETIEKKKISLTGIKPTGLPHLGNYLGSIQPALELAETTKAVYFIADLHALTTVRDGKELKDLTYRLAATWLACGLDPEKVLFFRQSDVPQLSELNWYLACYTSKGLLNRAHAFKAKVDQNKLEGNDPDAGINAGLFGYPVLMAADILLFKSDLVPVGQDQKQHVEISRDIAAAFNHVHGNVFTLPQPLIRETVKTVPGIDGKKMSKSYGNVIPIFAPEKEVKKQVMRIVTDSLRPEEAKDPDKCNVFNIFRHFADESRLAEREKQYREGGVGYGEMKEELFETLEKTFGEKRKYYDALIADPDQIDAILEKGSQTARQVGGRVLEKVRKKLGLR